MLTWRINLRRGFEELKLEEILTKRMLEETVLVTWAGADHLLH